MYMLLQVEREENGLVDGTHLQWCCACSFEQAVKRARDTECVNGNRITVAVIDDLYDSYAGMRYFKKLKRLD